MSERAFAMVFFNQEMKISNVVSILGLEGTKPQRVIPTGCRAVFIIDAATFFRDKGAGPLAIAGLYHFLTKTGPLV